MSDTQTILRSAGAATAGVVAVSLLAARSAQAAAPQPVTLYFSASPGTGAIQVPSTSPKFATASPDVQVLNFALAQETLEAELYRQALLRLTTGGTDMFGNAIPGLGLASTEPDVQLLTEFGLVENQHRDFITNLLGGNWAVAAGAKFDFGLATTNNFGTAPPTRVQTVAMVYTAELTGTCAYLGGAGVLTPGSTNLTYAAAILGVEARHATALAAVLNGPTLSTSPKVETAPLANENAGRDSPLAPDQILNQGGQLQGGITGVTIPQGGFINPVSGPKGFGGKGFVFI